MVGALLEAVFPQLDVGSTLCFVTTVVAVYYFIFRLKTRRSNFPPGPISLPIFGYLPFLGTEPYTDFSNLARKYGKVFSFYLGRYSVVVIGDWTTVKEAYTNPKLLGRPQHTVFNLIPEGLGIASQWGQTWQEQRRFSVTMLKYLTSKVNRLEETIQGDLQQTMRQIEDSQGRPISLRKQLTESGVNNIWYFLFGERIPPGHPKRAYLATLVDTMADYFGFATFCGFLPWLAKVFATFRIAGYDVALSALNEAHVMFGKEVDLQRKQKEEAVKHDTFVTGYLDSMEKSHNANEQTYFTVGKLQGTLQAFFLGGSETTRSSLEWALVALVAFPDVQRRVQKEIDDVVGRERNVQWADRYQMPYTMATINELQRWRTLLPIATPRCALEDTTLGEWTIPKGTVVVTNLWALHNDPKYWMHPEEFRPERFLSEDGKKLIKRESYAPFTLGRRKCPGDEMALTVIFISLTTVLQKYDVGMAEGTQVDIHSYIFGLTFQPVHHEMVFSPRH